MIQSIEVVSLFLKSLRHIIFSCFYANWLILLLKFHLICYLGNKTLIYSFIVLFSFFVGISTQRDGEPSEYELEDLSERLGESWKMLARHLGFHEGEITGFHKVNEEYSKRALKILFRWKQKLGRDATYGVLYDALCHPLVQRRDLAEEFCGNQRLHNQATDQPGELIHSCPLLIHPS